MAFQEISHEFNGTSENLPSRFPHDASTQEDNAPEAVERRRQARQEILERGRRLEERRRSRPAVNTSRTGSFDDFVDKDGALKPEASTTAAQPIEQSGESGLKHRHIVAKAATLGATFANPFADELCITHEPEEEDESGVRTPTYPASPLEFPPLPPKPAAYQPQALSINTNIQADNESETLSNYPSEAHLNLTPTTSVAPSSLADDLASLTPNSTHPNGQRAASPSPAQQSYQSVDEWAQQHIVTVPAAFYSPPQSEAGAGPAGGDLEKAMSELMSETGSMTGDGERVSQMGSIGGGWDSDMDDDGPGISTPGSWTDVGSTVSEDL